MSSKKRAWIIAVIIFLFAGPAAAYYTFREDPQIAKVKSLFKQARELKGDERKQAWQELQQTVDAMGPEKRVQMEMQRRGGDEPGGREKRMDELFALAPTERKAKLQEEIRKEEKRAKEYEADQAKQAAAAAANGGAGGVGGTGGGQNGQGGKGGPGGGRGGWGNRDPQQARLRLDFQSSESRAKRAEYSREKQVARVQMGLPPQTPRGGWGGGGGGGGRGPR